MVFLPTVCHNTTLRNFFQKVYFFSATVKNLRQTWLRAIIKKDKLPKKVLICSDHFEEKFLMLLVNYKMSCLIKTDLISDV